MSVRVLEELPADDEVLALYDAVGWSAYTKEPGTLLRALRGSSLVLTARIDGSLVGLTRVVSDDATICYLQDVLVTPSAQRSGIGRQLLEEVLRRYAHVRQVVLITDDEPGQRAFYESLGFTNTADVEGGPLQAFVQMS